MATRRTARISPSAASPPAFFGLRHSAPPENDQDNWTSTTPASRTNGTNRETSDEDSRGSPLGMETIDNFDQSQPSDYYPGGRKSLAGISLRAFLLGITHALSVAAVFVILYATSSPLWRLPFFLAALSLFHFLEFWTTAAFNPPEASIHAFLLTANWPAYAIAHAAACAECLLAGLLHPGPYPVIPPPARAALMAAGLALVVVGQTVRSAAMVTAGRSFNHTVQHRRAASHTLVTRGIYAWFRHPSYFGFFWWALGTQLVLGNVVCFVGYAVALWRFFSGRIVHEEEFLVRFFGREYEEYRKRVGVWIPFCG